MKAVLPGKITVLRIDRKIFIIIACIIVSPEPLLVLSLSMQALLFPAAFFVAVFHA